MKVQACHAPERTASKQKRGSLTAIICLDQGKYVKAIPKNSDIASISGHF